MRLATTSSTCCSRKRAGRWINTDRVALVNQAVNVFKRHLFDAAPVNLVRILEHVRATAQAA